MGEFVGKKGKEEMHKTLWEISALSLAKYQANYPGFSNNQNTLEKELVEESH